MDRLQERLARIGLEVAAERGFVLGGGHAVQLHGNPGFDRPMFAEALSYLERIRDLDFLAYGATPERIEAMRKCPY